MKKYHCHIIYLFLVLFAPVITAEAKYSITTSRIERLSTEFDIPSLKIDSCVTISYKGYPVIIESKNEEIKHIGLDIFGEDIRNGTNKCLYRFVEQYLLELLVCQSKRIPSQQMVVDGVTIVGDLNNIPLFSLQESLYVFDTYKHNRGYTIEWSNNHTTFTISFPSKYELIMGLSKIELENLFIKNVRTHKIYPKIDSRIEGDIVRISEDIFVLRKGFYMLGQMEHSYYLTSSGIEHQQDSIYNVDINHPDTIIQCPADTINCLGPMEVSTQKDSLCLAENINCFYKDDSAYLFNNLDSFAFVCDERYPIESLRNLLSVSSIQNDYVITIKINKYGFNQETISIPLSQLIDFCLQDGCIPYVGIENIEEEKIVAVLTMVQSNYGYNHVFRIEFNPKTLVCKSGVINSVAKIYIPTDSVSKLYGEGL